MQGRSQVETKGRPPGHSCAVHRQHCGAAWPFAVILYKSFKLQVQVIGAVTGTHTACQEGYRRRWPVPGQHLFSDVACGLTSTAMFEALTWPDLLCKLISKSWLRQRLVTGIVQCSLTSPES